MIGPSIKHLREQKKIKQKDLAEWLGVSRQAVSMWEAGKREVKVTTMHKIAHVFGVSLDEFITIHQKVQKEGENMLKKPKAKKMMFRIEAPQAKRVMVTGDFKSWDPQGIKLRKSKNGVWSGGVSLQPGRYEYKFIIDEDWLLDPSNDQTVVNAFGSHNSLIEVN